MPSMLMIKLLTLAHNRLKKTWFSVHLLRNFAKRRNSISTRFATEVRDVD